MHSDGCDRCHKELQSAMRVVLGGLTASGTQTPRGGDHRAESSELAAVNEANEAGRTLRAQGAARAKALGRSRPEGRRGRRRVCVASGSESGDS